MLKKERYPGWTFVCVYIDIGNLTIQWVFNGKVENETYSFLENYKRWPTKGVGITLKRVFGRLSNMKMFSKRVEVSKIKCNYSVGADLSWDINDWNLKSSNKREMMLDDVCPIHGIPVFIPFNIGVEITHPYQASEIFCENVGKGQIPTISNQDDLDRIILASRLDSPGGHANRIVVEEFWLKFLASFKNATAVGSVSTNDSDCNVCNSITCQAKPCSQNAHLICSYQDYPRLALRGLCNLSELDNKFYPFMDGKLYWIGESGDVIFSNDDFARNWRIRNPRKYANATLVHSKNNFASDNIWSVAWDDNCPAAKYVLSFTSCDMYEFNCNDGSCIDIRFRCDARSDCTDGSDELNCDLLDFVDQYNEYNNEIIASDDRDSKLDLFIDLDLKRFLEITENDGLFRVNFKIKLTWYDNRLQFLNLKTKHAANTLTEKEYIKIWKPKLEFKNSEVWRYEINSGPKIFVMIKNESLYQYAETYHNKNSLLYPGAVNNLTQATEIRHEMMRSTYKAYLCVTIRQD